MRIKCKLEKNGEPRIFWENKSSSFLFVNPCLSFLFFSFSNCQELFRLGEDDKYQKRFILIKHLEKKVFFLFKSSWGKKHKRKRIEIAVAPWSFLNSSTVYYLIENSTQNGIEKSLFLELQGWTNFASLWKMAVGKGFLGLSPGFPLFFVGVINVNLSAGQA